ncbi:hypothetical protein BCR34DRAFT_594663 [Clohesyomyces aquaticus]|uniref:Zn(2)-C6 fungal-type domain-containing protein n=1 Tax=Clohesyomyces aquaticus TaxID=1231657 RepID=A0A1Y1Y6J7_9PLEO|nr:hypothetical protein BCR34DRAFT_594663 [Clohesyomyces aquaticus]
MANFRPLQPAPTDEQNLPQHQGRPSLTQKPKRTVTLGACVPCRKRKSKCDGVRPFCSCCVQKDTECVFELWPNEKPSQAMKRKNEEMQGELADLREIYDFLQTRSEHEAQDLLARIRSRTPASPGTRLVQRLSDLAIAIRHGDLDPPHSLKSSPHSPSADSLDTTIFADDSIARGHSSFPNNILSPILGEPTAQRRRHDVDADVSASSDKQLSQRSLSSFSIEAILQSPSSDALEWQDMRFPAIKRWTTVTQDSNLLADLISSWRAWEHSYYHFLEWDIFLDDMASGKTNFCSRLLVNALLASASFQSALVKDRAKPCADNILNRFFEEAKRLWDEEDGLDNLPRLQAGLLLFLVLGKQGKDRCGYRFLDEACRIAQNLGLFALASTTSVNKPNDVPLATWDRARSVAAWALFNFQLSMTFTYSVPTALINTQPPLPIPYNDNSQSEGKHVYQKSTSSLTTWSAHFRSECDRHIIILDCSKNLLEVDNLFSDVPPKPEQLEVLYLKLEGWWQTRLARLNAMTYPTAENILAAMQYHVLIVRLMNPFLNPDSTLERVVSYRTRARAITESSLKDLRRLVMLHELRHGWSACIPYVLNAINITGFGTIEELSHMDFTRDPIETSEPYIGLASCLKALSAMSNFIYYSQPLYRVLTQACEAAGIPLPLETTSTMDYYRTAEWTAHATNNINSQYIADIRMGIAGVTNERMNNVVKSWGGLSGTGPRMLADRSAAVDGRGD